jgi:TfoX/Sxy family transcriptional regulator of competence genes
VSELSKEEYAAKLDLYEKLVATNQRVKRKGATMPYTSLNGHMFSFLAKDGKLALRLPSGERESFLVKYETELSVQHGAVMKEYVVIPDSLLERTQELKEYFDVSYEYVSSLKPKPTKKKKLNVMRKKSS